MESSEEAAGASLPDPGEKGISELRGGNAPPEAPVMGGECGRKARIQVEPRTYFVRPEPVRPGAFLFAPV